MKIFSCHNFILMLCLVGVNEMEWNEMSKNYLELIEIRGKFRNKCK